jgi:hypothetical protein
MPVLGVIALSIKRGVYCLGLPQTPLHAGNAWRRDERGIASRHRGLADVQVERSRRHISTVVSDQFCTDSDRSASARLRRSGRQRIGVRADKANFNNASAWAKAAGFETMSIDKENPWKFLQAVEVILSHVCSKAQPSALFATTFMGCVGVG